MPHGNDSADERWQRIRVLFATAASMSPSERDAYLDSQCGHDMDLRSEVEALLDSMAGDQDIRRIVNEASYDVVRSAATARLDQRIGRYRLTELIGSGGMGNVYLAARDDDQFEQRVAVKLLPYGIADPALVRRFQSERQTLAHLRHAHIAQLLDGGQTDDGVPYLVMEYVEGVPIDAYCDRERLSVRDRARLFQKVCEAVAYAHRNLIVHRDIKPSNILVDESGEPKLLDFGIAKALDEATDTHAALTVAGRELMTLEYASPEQVRGDPVSTAADIYSLGVLFYRLLCGSMPFAGRTGPVDLARAVVEVEPQPPSVALTSGATVERGDAEAAARCRRGSVRQIEAALEGDLDNIVLMALRKEPERRYSSALAMSEDIDRHLTHRTVDARRDSVAYRTSKFLRRHRVGVAITALVASVLAAAALQVVEQQRQAAVSAAQSDQIADFLSDLFASASPDRAQGRDMTASDLLAAGVDSIEQLGDQPAVQARLLDIMGASYVWIGAYDQGIALLERALDVRRNRLDDDPAAIGNTLLELSSGFKGKRDFVTATRVLEDSLAQLQRAHGARHARIAYASGRLADVLREQSLTDDALRVLERAIAMKESLGESDDLDMIDLLGLLAITYDQLGRLDEAADVAARVVEASRRTEGERHPNTAVRTANLGLIQGRQGRYDLSYRNIDEGYRVIRDVWPDNAVQIDWATTIRGGALRQLGRFEESGAMYASLLGYNLDIHGPDHLSRAKSLRQVGMWHFEQGQYRQALARYVEAWATVVALGAQTSYEGSRVAHRHAQASNRLGHAGAAHAMAAEGLAAANRSRPFTLLSLRLELAISSSLLGQEREASAAFEEILRERAEYSGRRSVAMLPSLRAASAHYRRIGRPDQALGHARLAYEIGQGITPIGNWIAALGSAEYAQVLRALGDGTTAVGIGHAARGDLAAVFGPDDARVRALDWIDDPDAARGGGGRPPEP